jgi:hypothetical protein
MTLEELVDMLNEVGFNIRMIDQFEIDSLSSKDQKQINELMLQNNPNTNKWNIIVNNSMTDEILKEVGFEWKIIDKKYLLRTINYVREVMSLNYENY